MQLSSAMGRHGDPLPLVRLERPAQPLCFCCVESPGALYSDAVATSQCVTCERWCCPSCLFPDQRCFVCNPGRHTSANTAYETEEAEEEDGDTLETGVGESDGEPDAKRREGESQER